MCIIDVEPHSIQSLRTKKLKPYVIFIKAPSPDRLRQTRRDARTITNCTVNRAFTEGRLCGAGGGVPADGGQVQTAV
ncbi:MAGUK p55 subfamily member 4-like [Perca fluviatilis]|uniref:MAGUK p55 subfamily member 4-like n=1 Tax=Perca fluviatilis TaxID=8168 RepID=UPI00196347EC|nr:MAGUK p55 subfamily member 4-like [Perca fluviatilis]